MPAVPSPGAALSASYGTLAVPVEGGVLHVGRWGQGGTVVVAAHGITAFVAVITAWRHPERVSRLVLVDGGLPLNLGPLADRPVAVILAAAIGPALERLHLTFRSTEAYLDYWRAHPALCDDWTAYMGDAFSYDLEGEAPELRSEVREAAVLADAETQLAGDDISHALESLHHPVVLVRAPKGMMGSEPPLYTDGWTAHWQRRVEGLRSVLVADVNHYTILFTDRGAKAVARIVLDELAGRP